jgi:hypothetical protein
VVEINEIRKAAGVPGKFANASIPAFDILKRLSTGSVVRKFYAFTGVTSEETNPNGSRVRSSRNAASDVALRGNGLPS